MSKFNFKEWEDKKVVMHCKTLEEAEDFCKTMHEAGLKWCTGQSYLDDNAWDNYESKTCYYFNDGSYSDIDFFINCDYKVFEWSDYMDKLFTKANLKNGDVCVCRNDKVYIAIPEANTLLIKDGYNALLDYNKKLESNYSDDWDIIKVYRPKKPHQCSFSACAYTDGELVYDRESLEKPIELTLEDIAKLKGVSVDRIKIVEKKENK